VMGLVLQAVSEELERAVVELAGARYERKAADQPLRRWGPQRGSVYLGDQKLPVEVPRVRNVDDDREISQAVYQTLQTPRNLDEGLSATDVERHCQRLLRGLCQETFGLLSPTVSRRYVKATARKLALSLTARASLRNRSS